MATPPRDLAIRILTRVLSEKETLEESFARLGETGASDGGRDRAWLLDVCSGVLRWKGRIDLAIDSLALKKKPTGYLRKALQVGFFQILAQDKADPGGVVFETVEAVKKKDGEAAAKFANALLRRFSESAGSWRELPRDPGFDADRSAQWASLPTWLWTRLAKQQGVEWAEAFARACLKRPEIHLRARDSEGYSLPEAQSVRGSMPGSWSLRGGSGLVTKFPGFESGQFIVQDLSSQFLVQQVSMLLKAEGARTIWDACAAPGGKAVGLAWNGFEVTASDRGPDRLALLRSTIERTRLSDRVRVLEPAVERGGEGDERFDAVWVDAPCMGTGIIRRHPEIRWNRSESDIESLGRKQSELLQRAARRLKPGGLLVYSACSVLAEEGPELLARVFPQNSPEKTWFLAPQDALGGDGFWAGVVRLAR